MLILNTINSILPIIEQLKDNSITYKIFTNHSERCIGKSVKDYTPNTRIVKVVLMAEIGEFYYEEYISLSDTEKLNEINSVISSLQAANKEVISYISTYLIIC